MPRELGSVQLVGAGPGSADLLTVRALRAIEGAEALLYDALVCDEVIALAPSKCVRIQTGKRSGKTSMSQDAINRLMLRLARRGLNVVRLKGGDPSIFGRSGEERQFLERQGVCVTVVPGVTAASAAAAQFGLTLTHRASARRVMFATARVEDGVLADDGWLAGADAETTLAVYMGRDAAACVGRALVAHGRSPTTPAIAVENAGRPDASIIEGTLETIGALLHDARRAGPVVILVGEVAGLRRANVDDLLREAAVG
jgi:uroporphyrin-III C-methyltransferase